MSYPAKNRLIDWLLTVLVILAGAIVAMWLFNGCSTASNNKLASQNTVGLTRLAQERQTQVGLINVSSENDFWFYVAMTAVGIIVVYLILWARYHWKYSDMGNYLCRRK